ncbi:MAG: hypothetical protein AAFR82_07480 [Pseudomonadota bacterium]
MMLKACRGVVLATGILSLPLFAQADCPPEDSIDRYAQTAGDALTALHELVPESQQQALEDRYAAMIVLKWQWQGRESVRADEKAMAQLLNCYQGASCGIDANDQITTQIVAKLEDTGLNPLLLESLIPRQPSAQSLAWAERVLGCNAPAQRPVVAAPQETLLETVEDQTTEAAPTPTATIVAENAVTADPTGITESRPTESLPVQRFNAAQPEPDLATAQSNDAQRIDIEPVISAPVSIAESEVFTSETASIERKSDAAPITVAQSASVNVNQLMLNATNLVSSGKPKEAIEPLETACFIQARSTQKSSACETLFSVYTNALVASEYSNSSYAYRDLSGRLCDTGYSRGCDNLSRYHAAQNSAEAHRAAVAYAEKSCDLGSAEACATVASFYLAGRASEPNPAAARAKLEESCQLGRLLSCQEVADYYLRGVGGDTDPSMALKMVEASCPVGSTERADLCVSAADYILINEPPGEDRSTRVRDFIKRACDIGHDIGCAWYAEDLEMGIGGAVDLRAARKARVTACQYGDQESCNSRS